MSICYTMDQLPERNRFVVRDWIADWERKVTLAEAFISGKLFISNALTGRLLCNFP